jgi:hypothetical protein
MVGNSQNNLLAFLKMSVLQKEKEKGKKNKTTKTGEFLESQSTQKELYGFF